MQAVTLLIAAVASLLVSWLPPVQGLMIYIAAIAWYPAYLTVKLGTVDFNVSRIVILVIFLNLLFRQDLLKHFKYIWLDKLVIIYFLAEIIAGATTVPSLLDLLENRAGAIFDMMLPYFAVRVIIRDREDYFAVLKAIVFIAAPLAVVGLYQCVTGDNPVGFLKRYNAWKTDEYVPILRHGFYRADVTFPMSIMFGLFFAMFGPVCAGLVKNVRGEAKLVVWCGIILMAAGVFSSMSSGPMLAALLGIIFIALYNHRRYWKQMIAVVIVGCIAVEIISNRHFYDVLGSFTLSSSTAWYRSKLIQVALYDGGMSGHWLTGFGMADPGWSLKIDGGDNTDIVNHYLLILSRYGLVGFIPFAAVIIAAIKRLVLAQKLCMLEEDRWMNWCLSGAIFGVLGAVTSVSLFGQSTTFFYIMLAFCGLMPSLIQQNNYRVVYSTVVNRGTYQQE